MTSDKLIHWTAAIVVIGITIAYAIDWFRHRVKK